MVGGSNVAIHAASPSFLTGLGDSELSEFSEFSEFSELSENSEIFLSSWLIACCGGFWALSAWARWGGRVVIMVSGFAG